MANTSKLSVILGVEGVERVIADAERAKDALGKNMDGISTASTKASAGLKKVESAAASLATQSAGLQGPLGSLAKSLLAFGPQGWVTVAVIIGIASINSSLNKHKKALEDATTAANNHRDALLELDVIQGKNTAEDVAVEKAQLAVIKADKAIEWYKKKHPGGFDPLGKGYNIELAALEQALQSAQDALAIAQAKKDKMRQKELDDIKAENDKRDENNQKSLDKQTQDSINAANAEIKRQREVSMARIEEINRVNALQQQIYVQNAKLEDALFKSQLDRQVALGNLTPQQARLALAQRELDKANEILAVTIQINQTSGGLYGNVGAAQTGQQIASNDVAAAEADVAAQKAQEYADQQKENLRGIQEYTDKATMAWGLYWAAVGGGKNIFGGILAAAAKALSKTAALEAAKNSALAVSETATGASMAAIGNLAGAALMFKAAAGHVTAASLWGALSVGAGVAGVAAGGIGGGGGGSSSGGGATSVNNTIKNSSQRATTNITIVGDRYLDTTNPEVMDALIRGIQNAGDGNIIVRGA